jgi:hypothetical protein
LKAHCQRVFFGVDEVDVKKEEEDDDSGEEEEGVGLGIMGVGETDALEGEGARPKICIKFERRFELPGSEICRGAARYASDNQSKNIAMGVLIIEERITIVITVVKS